MQLFTRNVQMAGPPAETMSYATDMRAFVTKKTGREIGLWANLFGAPVGAMAYTMRVEGLADLQTVTSELLEDPEYHQKLVAGREYVGAPSVDALGQPIHGELGDMPPVGSYAMVTQATMAGGKYMDAVAWGVEIAQLVEKLSGLPTLFLSSNFGGFGDVAWIMVAKDAAGADAAGEAINGNADYMTSVNGAGDLFIPGSGRQSLTTRIA
jgi:hypothetical protein